MVEKIEELHLPNSIVLKLVKEALPDGVNISKEARAALTRAASVFVLYLTSAASTAANEKKTILGKHVLEALEEIEFESFAGPVKSALETYQTVMKSKSNAKKVKKPNASAEGGDAAKNDEDEVMEIEDTDADDVEEVDT
jgi:DNA polymerase epsilon subunit 3